jgi:hypothetical protein
VADCLTELLAPTGDCPDGVLISLAGRSVRFRPDSPAGVVVARTILGPYCEITEPAPAQAADWTVASAEVAELVDGTDRLVKRCADAGIPPSPVRRWPGDIDADRYDLGPELTFVVHRRPFTGLTVLARADRTLHYLRSGPGFNASHTEHVLKYPLRTTLRQSGFAQVHAAGAVFRGRGLLLMGEKASGKSTLLAQLLLRGAAQVSNDLSFVWPAADGKLDMIAFPHITRVAPGTVEDNPVLRVGLAREERTGDYLCSPVFSGGKEEFYFPVLERLWGRNPICRRAALDAIVIPTFDLRCTAASSEPLSTAERDAMVRRCVVDDPPLPDWLPFLSGAQLRVLATRAADALLRREPPAYRVRFGPASTDPVRAVEQVVDQLAAVAPSPAPRLGP